MIGVARECNGLYYLMREDTYPTKKQLPTATYSSQSTSNYRDVWLLHYRWGHPPFTLLKSLFPTLFEPLNPSLFHCDVCVLSKHHHVSYPPCNKISSTPFTLIHSDVWGPSKIPNCSGARWFISFINDCTCMTWVFLLKDKATIRLVLPTFYKMIATQFGSPIKR